MPSRTAAGKEAFRRQAVLHREGADAAGLHQLADQGAVAFGTAGDKTAAMEIEHQPVAARPPPPIRREWGPAGRG